MEIEICESPDDEDYVEYKILHSDWSRGGADLRIIELNETHHMRRLLDKGLPSGSRIAETFFYPHSSSTQHREGVGSIVLESILKDAQQRNVRAIYGEVTSIMAENFFRKNGFDKLYGRHYYKILHEV